MTFTRASPNSFIAQLRGGLIVSCQALAGEPLHGPEDIRAIRAAVPLPLIGLYKDGTAGVYITPTLEHARAVAIAGADIVALDGTQRPRPNGETLESIVSAIHAELGNLVLADVSTREEGVAAQAAGADLVSTTLSGYTPYSPQLDGPDLALVQALARELSVPVIAEGRIRTPAEARAALEAGAFAVVVGGAITRPQWITAQFVAGLAPGQDRG